MLNLKLLNIPLKSYYWGLFIFHLLFIPAHTHAGGDTCTSIISGNWSSPATWNCTKGSAFPGAGAAVIIAFGDGVLLDTDIAISNIIVEVGGDLNIASSINGLTLTTDTGADLNNASINLNGDFTLTATTGDIILGSINGAGNVVLNTPGAGNTFLNGSIGLIGGDDIPSVQTDASGSTIINTQTILTTNSLLFNDPVILGANTTNIGSPNIQFMSTLDSDSLGLDTALFIAFSNFVAFHGNVGSNQPLERFSGATLATTLIAADMVISGTDIVFNGPVEIDNNPSITHSGVPIFSIRFNDTVNRADVNAQSTLTLNTLDSGDIAFFGDVTLDDLIITEASGSVGIFSNINTSDQQAYNGAVDVIGFQQLSAAFIEFNNTVRIINNTLALNLQSSGSIATDTVSGVGNLIKTGPGEFNLASNNTYTGTTNINAGILLVDGSTAAASLIDVNGGVLGGNGTANGQVNVNSGSIAPGSSPGVLATDDLMLGINAAYRVEFNGLIPGLEHDQLNVTGTVTINNASLDLSGTYIPFGLNDSIVIINNDGLEPITGIFANLPEGATINVNGPLTITYTGGDGNDVVLIDDEGLFADSFELLQ